MITQSELEAKWPREQFEQWKLDGLFPASICYEGYLEMRREQAELAHQQKIELFGEDLDNVPYEEPPDMTPEDKAVLDGVRRRVAAKMATENPPTEGESLPAVRVA